MKTAIAIITVSMGLASLPAHAQSDDTIKVVSDECRSWNMIAESNGNIPGSPDQVASMALDAGRCIGYIEGFLSGFSAGRGAPDSIGFCLPSNVSTGQVARVIAKKIEERPEFENVPKMAGMLGILSGIWPCPTSP